MSKLKTIGLLCVISLGTLFVGGCVTMENKVNPYSFDTAKIEYSLEGNLAGKQTVYIKGDMAAHRTKALKTVGGESQEIDMLYVEAGPFRYEVDMITKMATKSRNPIYEQMSLMDNNQKIDFLTRIATFADEGDPTPASSGSREIAGQTCKMYEIRDFGEICLWNGIPLYSKLSLAAGEIENVMTATSVQSGIIVEDSEFGIPLDVTIGDLTAA